MPATTTKNKEKKMKVKFAAILTVEAAIKAVERNGDALPYVLNIEMFKKIAAHFKISIEI